MPRDRRSARRAAHVAALSAAHVAMDFRLLHGIAWRYNGGGITGRPQADRQIQATHGAICDACFSLSQRAAVASALRTASPFYGSRPPAHGLSFPEPLGQSAGCLSHRTHIRGDTRGAPQRGTRNIGCTESVDQARRADSLREGSGPPQRQPWTASASNSCRKTLCCFTG